MLFRLRCYDMHIHVYAEPPMGGYRFSETIRGVPKGVAF